ncbi:hypothetical protein EJ08DRAFT_648896 [Tothia fuscella]|uniref:Uncharacterized protein n=1 Tax=Tothia fuscella TaxID=1048955 RepID=A0A9P4NSI9_9PEZI|nr:hypothetical protein EJ08DRAFT_648896 [Tothia fuscella]
MAPSLAEKAMQMDVRLLFIEYTGATIEVADHYLERTLYDLEEALNVWRMDNAPAHKIEFIKSFRAIIGENVETALDFHGDGDLPTSLEWFYSQKEYKEVFMKATGANENVADSYFRDMPTDVQSAIAVHLKRTQIDIEFGKPVYEHYEPATKKRILPAREFTGDEDLNGDFFGATSAKEKKTLIALAENNDRIQDFVYTTRSSKETAIAFFARHPTASIDSAAEDIKAELSSWEDAVQERISNLWYVRNLIKVHNMGCYIKQHNPTKSGPIPKTSDKPENAAEPKTDTKEEVKAKEPVTRNPQGSHTKENTEVVTALMDSLKVSGGRRMTAMSLPMSRPVCYPI